MKYDHRAVRVRFAPSPTGFMHLGNVRTALLNFLFAKKNRGTFVVRIEDTDAHRNFDPGAQQIQHDLQWLGLSYQEGPAVGGPHEPYFQSQRHSIYQDYLTHLIHKNAIYRCFCTPDELEKKRSRQIALKQPPRYDKACLQLTPEAIAARTHEQVPYIWRMKLDPSLTLTITDMARGSVQFEMRNFSDFPLSRADGTFTFMFANFVDDASMRITHVLRGEDHLSNTAGQAALYYATDIPMPIFWHLPILCNAQGSKLSKRDFGFALKDLRAAGYVSEAIVNYLAIIGGGSFTHEIMDMHELAHTLDFESIQSTGQVRYDLEKLGWVNQKWIARYDIKRLTEICIPFLTEKFPDATTLSEERLMQMIALVQHDLKTVAHVADALKFVFQNPEPSTLIGYIPAEYREALIGCVNMLLESEQNPDAYTKLIKEYAQMKNIPTKELFQGVRLVLTGQTAGPALADIVDILTIERARDRLRMGVQQLHIKT